MIWSRQPPFLNANSIVSRFDQPCLLAISGRNVAKSTFPEGCVCMYTLIPWTPSSQSNGLLHFSMSPRILTEHTRVERSFDVMGGNLWSWNAALDEYSVSPNSSGCGVNVPIQPLRRDAPSKMCHETKSGLVSKTLTSSLLGSGAQFCACKVCSTLCRVRQSSSSNS